MRKKLTVVMKFRRGALVQDSSGKYFLRLPFKGMHPVTAQKTGLVWELTDLSGKKVSNTWLFGGRV